MQGDGRVPVLTATARQPPPRSASLGLWPRTCSRLPACHLACFVYFCFNSFSFLRTFSRLGNSIGGCPQWLGCQQGGLPARSWQGENWTLPLPSPRGPLCPRLGQGTAAMAPRVWGVSASPFPLGNTARTPVFAVTWLFQPMIAAHQLRGTREKRVQERWDTFFCLEGSTPLNKCQEGGNKPETSPKCHIVPTTSPPSCHHFGGFADTESLDTSYMNVSLFL